MTAAKRARPAVYRPEPEAPATVAVVVHLIVRVDAGDAAALDAALATIARKLRSVATVTGTELPLPGMRPQ